jgi:hypothetical protein
MNIRIFRRASGRPTPNGSSRNSDEGRGSAAVHHSLPGRDSTAVIGTARSAAASSRLSAVIAALRYAWWFVTAPLYLPLALFGMTDDDGMIVGRRRGLLASLRCPHCYDVHDQGDECVRAIVGDCDVCARVVDLDAFGNCPGGRYHRVLNRRAKATGRRLRVVR